MKMANIIPIVSSSPPPLDDSGGFGWDDDEDDDFGTFTGAIPAPNNITLDTGLVEPDTCVSTTKSVAAELNQPTGSPTASSPDKNYKKYSSSDLECNCDASLTKTASLPHDHRSESIRNITKSLQLSQDAVSCDQCKNYANVANAQLTDSGVCNLNVSPVQQCDYNFKVNSSPLQHSESIQQSQACCFEISPTDITTFNNDETISEQTTATDADSDKESCSVHDFITRNFDSESLTSCDNGFCNIPARDIPIGDHIKVNEDCVQQLQTGKSNTISLSSGISDSQKDTLSNKYLFNGNNTYFDNVTEHHQFTNWKIIGNSVDEDLEVDGDLDCHGKSWNSPQCNVDINNENENLKASNIDPDNSTETIHLVTCDFLEESCKHIKHKLFSDDPTATAASNNIAIEIDSSSDNGDKCNVTIFNQSPKDSYICPIDNASVRGTTKSEVVHLLDNGQILVEHSDDTKQVAGIDIINDELEELSKSNSSTQEFCITYHVKVDCDNNEQVTFSDIKCSANEFRNFYTNDITLSEHGNDSINNDVNKIDIEDFCDVNTSMDDKRDDNSDQSEDWAAFSDVNYESFKSAEVRDWNAFNTNDKQDNALKGSNIVSDGKPDDWASFSGEQTDSNVIVINEDKTDWTVIGDEKSPNSTRNVSVKSLEEMQSQSEFHIMSKLEKLVYAVTMCFPRTVTDTEIAEDKVTTVLEGDNRDKSVWDHVHGQNATEALSYHWTKSEWNAQLFSTLHIDTKNMLISHKTAPVPVFATGHGLLEPTKSPAHPLKLDGVVERTKSNSSLNSDTQEHPTPAQLDWSGSGLINPLEADNKALDLDFLNQDQAIKTNDLESEFLRNNETPVHKSLLHPLENVLVNLKATSSTFRMTNQNEHMSDEARKIVNSLADLSFMMSRVLMFPLKTDS